jgi:PAS domain S-box-containing protein
VSEPYAHWLGLPADEIVGRPIREVLGEAAFSQLSDHFERVLGGEEIRYEEEVDFRGVGRRWVSAVYTPTHDADGAVDGWVAVVVDMEERRRAESRLRESEQKHRRIVETASEGIWMLDAEGRITFLNRRMAEMLGQAPIDILGRRKWDFAPEEAQGRMRELFERRRAGISEQVDVLFQHKDGRPVWAIMAARPVLDEAGVFQGSLDMFTDVTERRMAEDTVRSLLRISERLNSSLDVDELLDILVQEALALVGAESGVAGLRGAAGMSCKRYFHKGEVLRLDYTWPPGHGLPGWVLEHKRPYLTNDAAADTQIVHELWERFGVRSALSTPILTAQGEVVGSSIHTTRRAAAPSRPTTRRCSWP